MSRTSEAAVSRPGERSNERSIDRLLSLPAVFSIDMLCRTGSDGMTRHNASIFLMRMTAHKKVSAAGPKAGVYFNLVVDKYAPENRVLEAVWLIYPSAVVIGASVLHAHGWTTQIPQATDVAILKTPSVREFYGVNLVPRPRLWYQERSKEILDPGSESPFAISSLSPAAALEDLRADSSLWCPDPDDLDIPEQRSRIPRVK